MGQGGKTSGGNYTVKIKPDRKGINPVWYPYTFGHLYNSGRPYFFPLLDPFHPDGGHLHRYKMLYESHGLEGDMI